MGTFTPSFEGEVVFVTGASGGMGRAITSAFAAAGATVVAADVDDEGGNAAVSEATAAGGTARFVHCDVSDADSVRAAVSVATDEFGRLDCAVNAAAIENELVPLHECDDAAFDRMYAINVRGVFLCMKYEIATMLGTGKGAIVNIASTNAVRPQGNQPAYTAAKHAVLGLTRSAALDYGPKGIRINAILPGTIDTPMLRGAMARRGRNVDDVVDRLSLIGRLGRPEEIADATLWLCSDSSSFVLGHPLAVDAGYLTR